MQVVVEQQPSIVILNGSFHTAEHTQQFAEHLTSALGLTVVNRTVDYSNPDKNYRDHAREAIAAVDDNADFVLFANSHGGNVALSIAEQYPERTRGIIYDASSFREDLLQPLKDEILPPRNTPDFLAGIVRGSDGTDIQHFLRSTAANVFYNCCDVQTQKWAADLLVPSRRNIPQDQLQVVHGIPQLLLISEQDNVITNEWHEAVAEIMGFDEVVTVPGADHMKSLSQPDLTTQEVAKFMTTKVVQQPGGTVKFSTSFDKVEPCLKPLRLHQDRIPEV